MVANIHKQVGSIKSELEIIQCFLKDADARAETGEISDGVKVWVKQVRELAYLIEDVFDEYVLHLAERPPWCGFISFFYKITFSIFKLKLRHDIASQIQEIKTDLIEIKSKAERYGFSSLEQGSSSMTTWHDPRVASLFLEEDEVVGIESPRDKLISILVAEESKRVVISIVGMAGLGKTTLAKKVYDNQSVTGHFDCRAWIPVSQSYKPEDLLREMIKQFHKSRKDFVPEGIDTMGETSLISELREYLQSKRPLPEDKAWGLFCKKAFQSNTEDCPPVLKILSLEIVRRCEGLPLAIVAIGGLLSTKNKVVSEWQKLCHSLGFELERNPHLTSMTKIILLSYHDLPCHLKPCFLYFGLVPEDFAIYGDRLIKLWIAEGFVKEQKSKTLEEVGEEYLNELIHRSLVQGSEDAFYRVHDLVREIILSKFEELSFCQVLSGENPKFDPKTRRLSIHNNMDNVLEITEKLFDWIPKLQSLETLRLNWTRLSDDPMKSLQDLPNLVELTLYQVYDGERAHFEAEGFQKLKKLYLAGLKGLSSLKIDKGALPLLEDLSIEASPQLKEVPSGIHYLTKLTLLEFRDMPEEFSDRIEPDEGQDYWIVKHIPVVKFWIKDTESGNYQTYIPQD
ncbi:hypothetical protein F0562_006102 [Nyssa sinensis]|uniref:NB-ARC domain-containing protein n=1 Tax=Nyssa sinensis TaxID=561372 RepID=A0A5J5ANT8_9ASTE|nr:hypothetical protein F0562_006102 [Nyssa sinensis]